MSGGYFATAGKEREGGRRGRAYYETPNETSVAATQPRQAGFCCCIWQAGWLRDLALAYRGVRVVGDGLTFENLGDSCNLNHQHLSAIIAIDGRTKSSFGGFSQVFFEMGASAGFLAVLPKYLRRHCEAILVRIAPELPLNVIVTWPLVLATNQPSSI